MTQFVSTRKIMALTFLVATILSRVTVAQTGVATGVPQFSTTTSGPDEMNLGNLNVHWSFPVIDKPGRGLPFKYALSYDNSVTVFTMTVNGTTVHRWQLPVWQNPYALMTGGVTSRMTQVSCGPPQPFPPTIDSYSDWVYTDPSGGRHEFPGAEVTVDNCHNTTTVSGPAAAQDGSGYVFQPVDTFGGTVTTPAGLVITGVNGSGGVSVTDTNGNWLGRANPFVDTLGMTPITITGAVPQSIAGAVTYTYTDSTGTAQNVVVNYNVFSIQTAFGCSGIPELSNPTMALVSNIVYPDGSSYALTYEPTPGGTGTVTGRLQSVKLRTGGTITYTYTGPNGGVSCNIQDSSTLGLTRQTPDGTTSYSRTNISGTEWETVVTTAPDPVTNQANQINVFFQEVNGTFFVPLHQYYETKRQIFQGSNQGTPIKTIQTCYNGSSPDCTATQLSLPITQITELTQLSNGQQRQVVTFMNTAGLVTEKDEYDYGSSAVGPLLRKTLTQYASLGNNILDRPASVTVQDGAGHQIAQTQYFYDEQAPDPTSGVPNHASVTGSRGNATTIKRWLNTTNSFLATSNEYDDTGNLVATTDPMGHKTTLSYADNFSDGVNRNSLAYVTQTTLPDTNSPNLAHHVSATKYDANIGRVTSDTDQNGNKTDYTYDMMFRLLTVTLPADSSGNRPKTTLSYPDSNTVKIQKTVTTSLTDTVTATLDGLGRTIKIVHASPNGDVTTDAGYDDLGRLATMSNPHLSTSSSTDGTAATQYDALNRTIKVTKQDGSFSTVDYSQGSCVTSTDEAGKARRSCLDGLGRLIEVDEPGDAFAGSAASGSITVNGNLRSAQVLTQGGSSGTGSFTITDSNGGSTGGDRSVTTQHCVTTCVPQPPKGILKCTTTCTPQTTYDTGTIAVTVNGFLAQVSYDANGNPSNLATALASALSASGSPVTATASGNTVTMTAVTQGASTNYSWSSTSATNNSNFTGTSFPVSPASGALSGGADPVYTTVYDSGTATISVGAFTGQAIPYGQSSNSTGTQMASALASSLNVSGSPVSAQASGSAISIAYKSVGASGNVAVTITSTPNNPTQFPGGSFGGSTTLSGGADPYSPGLAHPYATLYSYQYDASGNLNQCVEQHGNISSSSGCSAPPSQDSTSSWRIRRATYNSLGQLTQATNPESGAVSYAYNNDGALVSKTDARGTTINFSPSDSPMDTQNRVTKKEYSNGDPAVTYSYDQGANGIGRSTGIGDSAGSTSLTYDALGRTLNIQRAIGSVTKNIGYAYNLDGSYATVTYPSGAVVTYTLDSNGSDATGRFASMADQNNGINYLTNATYGAHILTGYTNGSGITNSFTYNNRLQPLSIQAATSTQTLLSLTYDFHAGNGDNGNVFAVNNGLDPTLNQSFTYDLLNRLTSAQTAGTDCTQQLAGNTKFWGDGYGYDPWGNLLTESVTNCSGSGLSVAVNTNNQLTNGGFDASGNMIRDPAGNAYGYDAEGRITGAAGTTYVYDGLGNRVEKSNGGSGTIYWYGLQGVLAETDLAGNTQKEYVFFGGKRIASRESAGNVSYYFSDHLNSTNVLTDAGGNVISQSYFRPWGEEMAVSGGSTNHYKFTGKERDSESQLDYFGARYYNNALGRWMSADWSGGAAAVPYADFGDPQTLNLYAYVGDNPVTRFDADGHIRLGSGLGEEGGPLAGEIDMQDTYDLLTALEAIEGSSSGSGGAAGQQNQPGGNSQGGPRQLTQAEVVKIINEARKNSSDPVTTAIKIFSALGSNVTVSGDVLRGALAETGFTLPATMEPLLAHAQQIAKSGNGITITNDRKSTVDVDKDEKTGKVTATMTVDKTVSFTVAFDKKTGLPGLTNVRGLSGSMIGVITLTADVKKMQVVMDNGERFVRLDLSVPFKHPEFPIPTPTPK